MTNQAIGLAIQIRSIVGNDYAGSFYIHRPLSHTKTMQEIASELQRLNQPSEQNFPDNFEHLHEIETIETSVTGMSLNAHENIRLAIEAANATERIALQAIVFVRKL